MCSMWLSVRSRPFTHGLSSSLLFVIPSVVRDSSPSSFRPVLGLAVASVSLGCPSRQAAEVVSLSRDALTPPRVPSEAVR